MSDIVRVSPAEALAKMQQGWIYVDVRTEVEFAEGHPTGSYNVPGPGGVAPNADFIRVMNTLFPRDTRIIVGCRSGGRSLRAAQALAADGYTNILDQRAGWDGTRDTFGQVTEDGWTRLGLPSERGSTPGKTYADLRRR